ncbi:MAG: hypothetical protein HY646_19015 [Acidobacteria bacterium]|nr:hypothetical protein [Acidobacteriota bacterium]
MSKQLDISLKDFFAAIIPEGFIECRAIDGSVKKVIGRDFVPAGNMLRIQLFTKKYAAVEVYFGVVSRSNDHDGTAKGCAKAYALFTDVDFKDTPESKARELLTAFPIQPSIIISSGNGLHCYWLLCEPYDLQPKDNPEKLKSLLRQIARALGGDIHAGEPARVLRIPHTMNHKYSPERPVLIETFNTDVS